MLISDSLTFGRLLAPPGDDGGDGGGGGQSASPEGGGQSAPAEGGDGGGQPAPSEGLASQIKDEGLREWVEGKGWQDAEGLARSAYNLEKLKGAPAEELVRIPSDATPEQAREVLQRLGLPDSPDKYELPDPPEGLSVDPDFQDFIKQAFHETGLPARMASELTERYNNYLAEKTQEQQEQLNARFTEEHEALKKEWGNGYDRQLRIAQHAAKELGIEADQIDQLEQTMGFAGTMRLFSKIGRALGEDRFVDGSGDGDRGFSGQMTPAEAKAAYAKFISDSGNLKALTDKSHPGHKAALEEKQRLFSIMYPDQAS